MILYLFLSLCFANIPTELKPTELNTPYKSLSYFLEKMNAYKKHKDPIYLQEAQRVLDLSTFPMITREEQGKLSALYLKEILDRIMVFENLKRTEYKDFWKVPGTDLKLEKNKSSEFVFSSDTIEKLKRYYRAVNNLPYLEGTGEGVNLRKMWGEHRIPIWLKKRIFGVELWQILGIVVGLFAGLLGKLFAAIFLKLLEKVSKKSKTSIDDQLLIASKRPASLLGACAIWYFVLISLRLDGILLNYISNLLQILVIISIIWFLYNSIEVFTKVLNKLLAKANFPVEEHLLTMMRKSIRTLVVILGILVTLQNLGINVMGLMAGLGLGGLAFALAAKDTAANLFGSLMILLDRPFKVGDSIVANGQEGVVEDIGLRSTRIRTFYKSLVSLPNAMLTNAHIDNMGQRLFRRYKTVLEMTYQSNALDLENYISDLRKYIQECPEMAKTGNYVSLNNLNASGIAILIYCFFDVPDWENELKAREKFIYAIMDLAKKNNLSFAYPSQSIYLEKA